MNKTVLVVCALIAFFAVCPALYAATEDYDQEYVDMNFGSARFAVIDADKIPYGEQPLNKLGRGLINTATFWAEVPAQVAKVSREKDPFMGTTVGVVQGTITSLVRAGTGLIDTVTFMAGPYDQPIMKPEYALNRADKEIQEYLW